MIIEIYESIFMVFLTQILDLLVEPPLYPGPHSVPAKTRDDLYSGTSIYLSTLLPEVVPVGFEQHND
jgi:hypothetical protein